MSRSPDDAAAERLALVPQMAAYDALRPTLRPYVTLGAPRSFRSAAVNTDAEGLRISHRGETAIDAASWFAEERRGLVVGSSFVFGVGSSSDRETLPSLLSEATGISFLNLGIRAGNSTQELIAAIPFLREAHVVVLATGVNNAFSAARTLGINDLFGPFFWEGSFEHLAGWPLDDLVALTYEAGGSFSIRAARRLRLVRTAARSASRAVAARPRRRDDSLVGDEIVRAADRHARDLAILAAAVPPGARCVFAAQPFADTAARELAPEEERLFALTTEVAGMGAGEVRGFVAAHWAGYLERLEGAAAAAGLPFTDLGAAPLAGWCFVDRVHMTDRGYRLAAAAILELLA